MEDIVKAAMIWFRGFEPIEFTLQEHLNNPTINMARDGEKLLAIAVAEYMSKQLDAEKL